MAFDVMADYRGRVLQDHMVEDFGLDRFAMLAVDHPGACSPRDNYPGWEPKMGCVRCPGKGTETDV